jgi:AcrR family transcriptional regulator
MDADRRRLLVSVAADEFASAGYNDASLNRIIARCGMSKSSFYYFIPSKNDLFDFVVRELIDEVGKGLEIPEAGKFAGDDYWRRVQELFTHMVRVAEGHQSFATLGRMFYSDAPEGAKGAVSGTLAAVRKWVEELLRVGRRSGAVRNDLPEALQFSLVMGILQVFDEWTVGHYDDFTPADLRLLGDAQFATIRRVLEP